VVEQILADNRHTTTREAIRQAILQRTTRGMLTFNTGRVHQIDDDLWAVPSTRGGFYQVNLIEETCPCEDFTFYCSERGLACRHVVAAAIAREKRRLWLRRAARVISPMFMDGAGDAR
jgi:predicted nucleic acid-binding Zn finger protein